MKCIYYKCDFCYEEVKPKEAIALKVGKIEGDSWEPLSDGQIYHYHPECFKKAISFCGGRPGAPEPEADLELARKEKTKKDLGKLRALLDNHWSQKKIADEFGVAPSTITAWKKEIEAKEDGIHE